MNIAIYIILIWFGLALGSFVNAWVWRLHEQLEGKKGNKSPSIVNGRSICPRCRHQLAWRDLVPVLSWVWLKGRCRYCKKSISLQYPLVELSLAIIFALSYAFWPVDISGWQWPLFISWLVAAVGLAALFIYDSRWMVLPRQIIYPATAAAAIGRLAYILGAEPHKLRAFFYWVAAVAVAGGIFWVLYAVSKGEWIGFGDVRLGLLSGTLLATPAKSFLMIFMASVIGVAVIAPALAAGKKSLSSKMPYGPFLITATAVCVLFGQSIIDWYKRIFLI